MTPTPAEIALWRALNVEPRSDPDNSIFRNLWVYSKARFDESHPADRLAYFEGKVREKGWRLYLTPEGEGERADWFSPDDRPVSASAPIEHLARFHAAARAIHALGMITEQQLKEISDAG